MPIITQLNATKLRSLKYGNDTSDGGNSGQPYVKTELKDLDKPFTRFRLTKFDDGLIRGGAVGALNASVVDTIRIGKFLKDFPKGPLFIAKQVGLQLSNPKLETKKGLGGLIGKVGSTRLYNLGINTLAQVPLNAFGGHLVRHGLLPVMDESTKYINVVTENNREEINIMGGAFGGVASFIGSSLNPSGGNNRLVALTNKFNLGDNEGDISRQFNLQEARRENIAANREGRQANRDDNRFRRQLNRFGNQQGRQFNRSENRRLRQWSKEFGNDNFVRSEFVRSKFTRNDFKRNKLDTKTLTIDSYNGGPNSVYGIGRTIINRYAFTEDKIKIDDAFFKSTLKTISGSLSVNPLASPSVFEKSDGGWDTGSIASPLSPQYPLNKIEETDQFNALGRKRQGADFFSSAGVSTSKLQNDIGNGNIFVNAQTPQPPNSVPPINPIRSAPFDKFSVIKSTLVKEDTDYVKGVRVTPSLFSTKQGVKASIVNVKPMEGGTSGLEETYKRGEMVFPSRTSIEHETNNGKSKFKTENVSVNRDAIADKNGNFYYLNKKKTVDNFKRTDRNIMLVSFDTINPFTAEKERTVVFSAYLSGFKYNSNSTWNPIKYVGRSESFYTFTEHKRDVSFNIQVPCFNRTHLLEKHRGLSELQSAGAGKYDGNNRLGGVITKVTLGSYLVDEPGILTSVSFDIPDVSSWDIDEKLAMYINAQFNFTIIGKELPTYKEGGFLSYLPNIIGGTGFLTGSEAR